MSEQNELKPCNCNLISQVVEDGLAYSKCFKAPPGMISIPVGTWTWRLLFGYFQLCSKPCWIFYITQRLTQGQCFEFWHNKLGYKPIPSFSLDAHHVPLCATYLLGCCTRWSTVCGNPVQKREKAFQVSHSGFDSMFWCQELFIFGQQDVSQTRLVTSSLLYSCQLNILNPVLDCPCLALRATAASLAGVDQRSLVLNRWDVQFLGTLNAAPWACGGKVLSLLLFLLYVANDTCSWISILTLPYSTCAGPRQYEHGGKKSRSCHHSISPGFCLIWSLMFLLFYSLWLEIPPLL